MEIPKELQNPLFRFCLNGQWNKWGRFEKQNGKPRCVETKEVEPEDYESIDKQSWKPFGKSPKEGNWQKKNNYNFDSEKLKEHPDNAGIIMGFGNVRVIDVDGDAEKIKELDKENTFSVQSRPDHRQYYFLCDAVFDKAYYENPTGELRCYNTQCVIPNCRHPSGTTYTIINNAGFVSKTKEELLKLADAEEGKRKGKRKNKKSKYDYMSFFEMEENNVKILIEQILDKEGKSGFVKYNTGTGKAEIIDVHKSKKDITPCEGEEVQEKYIRLPSGIEEYESDEKLDEDLKSFIRKWLDIDAEHLRYAVWCIKQSWIYDVLNTINYLRVLGDVGMGKTRYMDTIGSLHYKPISTGGATTSAPIFRIIKKWKGTMILDEFDLRNSDETAEIIKVINLGFEKRKPIMRCVQNNPNKIEFFDPYCPKVIATRKSFNDLATESRCFTTIMKGTQKKNIPVLINEDFDTEQQQLRNKLLLWRFRNYYKIKNSKINTSILDDLNLEPRVRQSHLGFLPLFAKDKIQVQHFKDYLKEYQSTLTQERKESFEGQIMEAFCRLVNEGYKDI